ncbi:MAG: hypothetical protein ACHQ1H_10195, partial [Nitrososphaerales archaeon]
MKLPSFDFSNIPIVDMHVHGPLGGNSPGGLFGLTHDWYEYFVNGLLPEDVRDEKIRADLLAAVIRSHETRPTWVAVRHYEEKYYGGKKSSGALTSDELEQRVIKAVNKAGVTRFAEKVFQRENIEWVLVDHSSLTYDPKPMMEDFPEAKKKWTHPIVQLLQPEWALGKSLETVSSIISEIKKDLQTAMKNNAVGFKSTQAYFRDFDLSDVNEDEAQKALGLLMRSKPERYEDFKGLKIPIYASLEETLALKTYQDFLLKNIFAEAGRLNAIVLIHVAVWVTPTLKPKYNDPNKLYSIFDNDSVRRANTKFVLLHTGYPENHKISSIITQYPNVYVDLSCPALLEESILGE